jgi:hypothetical protein
VDNRTVCGVSPAHGDEERHQFRVWQFVGHD